MAHSAPFQPELACRCADARKFPSPGRKGQGGGGQHRARLEDEPHKIWRPSPYGPTAHFGTISPDSSDVTILQSGCRGRLSSRGWAEVWGRRPCVNGCYRRWASCQWLWSGRHMGQRIVGYSITNMSPTGPFWCRKLPHCDRYIFSGWGSTVVSLEAREDNSERLGALGCPQSGDQGRMGFLERALGAMRGGQLYDCGNGSVSEKGISARKSAGKVGGDTLRRWRMQKREVESEPESEEEKNSLPRLHRQELPQETWDSTTRDEHGGDEMGGVDPHRRVASPQASAQSRT
ncbi:hypothetical protein BD779DRAFT_1479967 [Infundibulicybe gibba]|nr:hypothetical protein BD779DRAFT_1479967 [Infundibulicybe gibba]